MVFTTKISKKVFHESEPMLIFSFLLLLLLFAGLYIQIVRFARNLYYRLFNIIKLFVT